MKKIIFCIITLISIFAISCKNEGGSIYAMEQRYKNFLNILPKEIRDDYLLTSSKYSNEYKMWIDEFDTWASNTINKENEDEKEIASRLTPDRIEYALETLTSRNYERALPLELMSKVKTHTDNLSLKIKELEQDEAFSNSMYKLKQDEAVTHFNTDDTIFYYVWNYLITINRDRRFQ